MRMAASSWTFFRNVIALSLAHSLPVIRHLAGNLSHRQSIGSACGPRNVHASSRQFHKAENDQTGQTGSLRRSHREEYGGHDLMPMSLEELFPGRLPRSFRRWLDAVPFQNVPDRVVCQIVTQVGQCSLYPSIAPGTILLSHADSQSSNFRARWSSAPRLAPTASVLSANQISVPRQQSFRRGDGRHLLQRFPAQLFRFGRQSPSLVIVELQTPITHLLPKDAILLDQICDNLLLMSAHPSSDGKHHN